MKKGISPKECKTICLGFASEEEYERLVEEREEYRKYVIAQSIAYPELFPSNIKEGFKFCGFVESKKQGLKQRRLKLTDDEVYQIRPSFVMPYMISKTAEIEKALYLRQWGVPFEALAYVFGGSAMFYYRAYLSLGRPSIVATTIKKPEMLPQHLLADEKHTWINGEKLFGAMTVAEGCILGVGIAQTAQTKDLTEAYQDFKDEAVAFKPDYQPLTVNTDGWLATQLAWRALFINITLILCFLHAWLKIQNGAKRLTQVFPQLKKQVWHLYHSNNRATFAQRLRRFRDWAITKLPNEPALAKILQLSHKSAHFKIAFDHPQSYRTSAHLDRLMNYQDRQLYAAQYFHGHLSSAKLFLRASAMLWNFHPYGTRTQANFPNRSSPFADLNGFQYHPNWLHNFLISSSHQGSSFKHINR